MKAIILGSGPSGTSLGWFLSSRNWEVDIIEMKNVVGGLARSSDVYFKDKKITLDSGPHIFHTNDQEMINIWKENFGEFWVDQNLFSANAKGSKFDDFHDYPISKRRSNCEGLSIANCSKG